ALGAPGRFFGSVVEVHDAIVRQEPPTLRLPVTAAAVTAPATSRTPAAPPAGRPSARSAHAIRHPAAAAPGSHSPGRVRRRRRPLARAGRETVVVARSGARSTTR